MRRPTDLIFQLEHQFTLYLQRCKVSRADLGVEQLREMRRAFYGGLGQMFFLVTQDVGSLEKQRDQVMILELMQKQIGNFWTEEQEAHERGLEKLHPTMAVKCDCGFMGQIMELVLPKEGGGKAKCPKCGSEDLYFKN